MKRGILFFIVFFISVLSFAQNVKSDKAQIIEDNQSQLKAIQNKNYDLILDLTYPSVYNVVDRNTMRAAFQQLFEGNNEVKMEFVDLLNTSFDVSEIYETKEHMKYAFVTYPLHMKMTYLTTTFDSEKKKLMENIFRGESMEAKFLDDKTISVQKENITIALNDQKTKGQWKYVNFDGNISAFTTIFPDEIVTKAKELSVKLHQKLK